VDESVTIINQMGTRNRSEMVAVQGVALCVHSTWLKDKGLHKKTIVPGSII
jgi:hypothetical protein